VLLHVGQGFLVDSKQVDGHLLGELFPVFHQLEVNSKEGPGSLGVGTDGRGQPNNVQGGGTKLLTDATNLLQEAKHLLVKILELLQ